MSTTTTFRKEVETVLCRQIADAKFAGQNQVNKYVAYEDAKESLSSVCEDHSEYEAALREYIAAVRL